MGVQNLELIEDRCHFENGIVAALRCRAMAADPRGGDFDFHSTALAPVNPAGGRFRGYNEFRPDLVLINNILPAEAVTVFLLNGSGNQECVIIFQV